MLRACSRAGEGWGQGGSGLRGGGAAGMSAVLRAFSRAGEGWGQGVRAQRGSGLGGGQGSGGVGARGGVAGRGLWGKLGRVRRGEGGEAFGHLCETTASCVVANQQPPSSHLWTLKCCTSHLTAAHLRGQLATSTHL